jgi:hypothetical protein
MASIYDTTANDYSSHFRSINITDSGTFKLLDEAARKLSVHNDGGEKVRVYKTENHNATTSGTSNAVGVYIGVEDGVTFNVAGIGNGNQISVQMDTSSATPYDLKYIVFK